MSKFNRITARFTGQSPVRSDGRAVTFEGAAGWHREPRGELFLLAVTNLVGEDTFYEAAADSTASGSPREPPRTARRSPTGSAIRRSREASMGSEAGATPRPCRRLIA